MPMSGWDLVLLELCSKLIQDHQQFNKPIHSADEPKQRVHEADTLW